MPEVDLIVVGLFIELFIGSFPMVLGVLSLLSSRQYHIDTVGIVADIVNPSTDAADRAAERWPTASVVLSARNEEQFVGACLQTVLDLRWPNLDVVVVNDGSTDRTGEILAPLAETRQIRLITHDQARGKSQSINEALAIVTSPIVLVVDADCILRPDTLQKLTSRLAHHNDVAAVTANPRMLRTDRFVEKLQAVEFSSTVSALRRGQAAWGRVATMSGICTLLRTEAIRQVGGYSTTQPTEDIELTWRLHTSGWRVLCEPAAAIGMHGARTFGSWWTQRRRWSRGLVHALRTHGRQIIRPRHYSLWPLALEATLGLLWCHLILAAGLIALVQRLAAGSVTAFPNLIGPWGALMFAVSVGLTVSGIRMDQHYDKGARSLYWYAPLVPLGYWLLNAAVVVRTAVISLLEPADNDVTWEVSRVSEL